MSPSQFHAKKEMTSTTTNNINGLLPPPLKINKESHFIKKSSSSSPLSSSSSSSISSSLVNSAAMTQVMPASSYKQPQQRHPVIIYTHSPKVIHTNPKDFMSLVQKLTGLSRSDDEEEDGDNPLPQQSSKQELGDDIGTMVRDKESDRKNVVVVRNEDNETSSVITEENNCSSSMGENQVNSCFMREPSMLEPPLNPYVSNLPMLPPRSTDFVCSSQPLLNYSDSLFFSHNIRTSIQSSTTLEGIKEFREH